jgi:threonine-phosphate decarboxylase
MMPLHGASIEATYKAYDVAMPKGKIIDFSTNTNSLTLPESIHKEWQTMTKDIQCINQYPASEYEDLLNALANNHDMSQDQVMITNGTNEAIYLLASYLAGARVGIIEPTYPEYLRAMSAYDAKCVHIDWKELAQGLVDFSVLDTLILCNPNNPTGQYMNQDQLGYLIEETKKNHVQIILDQAYVDFLSLRTQDISDLAKEWIKNYPHLIILRSLTKIFKIPGIRLGYVMGNPQVIKQLQKRQPSWSVNRLALSIGIKLIDETGYIEKTKVYYRQERERITKILSSQGWEVIPSEVNFFMIKTEEADKLIRWCLKRGLVLRHTKNHQGLKGKYVRIGLQRPEENTVLTHAFSEYRQTIER